MSGEYSLATRALLKELDPYGIAGDDLFYSLDDQIKTLRIAALWCENDSHVLVAIANELESERQRCCEALCAADA